MRPRLPDSLGERLKQEVDETGRKLHKEAGYSTINSLVEQCVRERVEEIEEEFLE